MVTKWIEATPLAFDTITYSTGRAVGSVYFVMPDFNPATNA